MTPAPRAARSRLRRVQLAIAIASLSAACSAKPDPRKTNFEVKSGSVTANYDNKTGRLKRLAVDLNKNGVADTWSYMDGTRVERVEADNDENGQIDRWEHYADGALISIGTSTRGDGVEDQWAYQSPGGALDRVETDTDRDGKIDKWERYYSQAEAGRPAALRSVETEPDAAGHPTFRLRYRADGSFERSEKIGTPK